MSDRYSAQFGAERAISVMRGWSKLHLGCEVHMSTSALSQALTLTLALARKHWPLPRKATHTHASVTTDTSAIASQGCTNNWCQP